MNTEKTPTIYGTVTFEQFDDAVNTVCKYVEGLANTYTIKDMQAELIEKAAAKERAAQAETNSPSEPAQAEPGNTYGPKTENL